MEDIKDFTPELVTAWAQTVVLAIDTDNYKQQLSMIDDSYPKSKELLEGETKEQRKEYLDYLEQQKQSTSKLLATYQTEWKTHEKEYFKTEKTVKEEKKNDFAENIETHLEDAQGHLERFEEAFDEL